MSGNSIIPAKLIGLHHCEEQLREKAVDLVQGDHRAHFVLEMFSRSCILDPMDDKLTPADPNGTAASEGRPAACPPSARC
jgi:hypothetical protein